MYVWCTDAIVVNAEEIDVVARAFPMALSFSGVAVNKFADALPKRVTIGAVTDIGARGVFADVNSSALALVVTDLECAIPEAVKEFRC